MGEGFSLIRKYDVVPDVFYDVMTDGLFACSAYKIYGKLIAEQRYMPAGQRAIAQQQIVARLYDTIGASLLEIEAARSRRERPTDPDAFDLVLQAHATMRLPSTVQRESQIAAHFEGNLAIRSAMMRRAKGNR